MKTPRVVIRDDAVPDAKTYKSRLYHIYQDPEVKDDLNRRAKPEEPLPDLVTNGYYLLGYDWRETAKDWTEKGAATPPVMITVANRTETAGRLKQRLRTLTHPALLVVDEIGYLSVTPNGARLFFQLVNARYGHASTVLTSNKGFEHWGEILHDEVMAAALLDRLLHRCHLVNIRGNSYRMRRHMELSKAIHPTASRAADPERAREGDES